MGFWRIQGLVNLSRPCGCSRTRKIIKKAWVFKLFQKKWCWRSSFELHLFIFRWMLQLILLFLLQNWMWPQNSASSATGRPREPWRLPKGSQKPKLTGKWPENDRKMNGKWLENDQIYMCINVYTCIYMYIHVYTCIYMYINVYPCIHIYIRPFSGHFPVISCKCFGNFLIIFRLFPIIFSVIFRSCSENNLVSSQSFSCNWLVIFRSFPVIF